MKATEVIAELQRLVDDAGEDFTVVIVDPDSLSGQLIPVFEVVITDDGRFISVT